MDKTRLNFFGFIFWQVLFLFIWLVFPKEYIFSDPMYYAVKANDLANLANWSMGNPRDHRLGLLLVQWASQWAFGYSSISYFLPQIVLLLALNTMVLQQCSNAMEQAVAGTTLSILLPQSVTIFPDIGAATFMFAAVLFLSKRDEWWRAIVFVALGFLAFLFKLTAYWLVFPFAILAIQDLLGRRGNVAYYFAASIIGLVLLLAYFWFYQSLFDDPFLRLKIVSSFGPKHLWAAKSVQALIVLLTTEPFSIFYGTFGLAFFFSLIGGLATFSSHRHIALGFWAVLILMT